MKKQIQVPRWMFQMWTEGIILDRRGTNVFVVNENLMREAESALANGEPVYLTFNSQIVSYFQKDDTGYTEKPIGE